MVRPRVARGFRRAVGCGLASMYPASDWSFCSGPSWISARIDADHGDRGIGCLRHGVLLVFGAPCRLRLLAGQEHGRTIPLADIEATRARPCGNPEILGRRQ